MKILLVEDEEILSKALLEEFKEAGFDMACAQNGAIAREKVKTYKPDIILLDLLLPEVSGVELLQELKQNDKTSHIPIVVLSMLGSKNDIESSMDLGADDYIIKSRHSVHDIVEKIKQFIKNYEPRE